MNSVFFDEFDSPLGIIRVEVSARGEVLQVALKNAARQSDDCGAANGCGCGAQDPCQTAGSRDTGSECSTRSECCAGDSSLTSPVREQLIEYLSGKRKSFSLTLKPEGTPFQKAVWNELLKIPYGTTTTYAAIAAALGKPKACRAVGRAVGANPICIIIPCHRVIGSSGELTGFAYGLDVKRTLLSCEGSLKVS